MKYTITVIEHDGLKTRSFVLQLESLIDDPDFDIHKAIVDACNEFIGTTKGYDAYFNYNCENFNWADFEMYVPNEICRNHGFCKLDSSETSMEVDWDEQLVDEPFFHVTHINWDTSDGDEIDDDEEFELPDLPTTVDVPIKNLLSDDEQPGDVPVEELRDRVADYLSDEYGWCIYSLVVNGE